MKIRKTIQGSIPSNKVYNSYNEDKHNTYSTEYLNDKLVHVGKDIPANQEKIWVQKGKNLFNPETLIAQNGVRAAYTVNDTGFDYSFVESSSYTGEGWYVKNLKLKKGETYSLSFDTSEGVRITNIRFAKKIEDIDGAYQSPTEVGTNQYVLVAKDNYACLRFWITNASSTTVGTNVGSVFNIQLEHGNVVTDYENYIDKKLLSKNNNQTYEEIYNEDTHLKTQVLWINGRPNEIVNTLDIFLGNHDFDFYEIIYKQYYQNPYYQSTGKIPKGCGANIMSMSIVPSSNVGGYYHRVAQYNSNDTLTVCPCNGASTQGSGTITIAENHNTMCIPTHVIGYKLI